MKDQNVVAMGMTLFGIGLKVLLVIALAFGVGYGLDNFFETRYIKLFSVILSMPFSFYMIYREGVRFGQDIGEGN